MTDEKYPPDSAPANGDRNGDRNDDRIDALVRDLDVAAPAPDFADRVMRAHGRRRVTRVAGALAASGGVLAAAAAVVVVFLPHVAGDVVATERQSVHVGGNVVAVLEPDARITYDAPRFGGGNVVVQQPHGHAFYRVDKGTPVDVVTPAGAVHVHGTCFTVDLQEEPTMIKKRIPSAALGAVAGALLTVVVFEGSVVVANEKGEASVGPGQVASSNGNDAPTVKVAAAADPGLVRRLRTENEDLRAALDNAKNAASTGDVRAVLAENQALRAKLQKSDDELALADAARKDTEGVELPFPKDLPARFAEKELLASFTTALKQAGIDGDVTHIDCAEFPCIVYGDVKVTSDMDATKIGNRMKESAAFAPYKDDEDNSSWWRALKQNPKTGETEDETHFGIALWPKGGDDNEEQADGIGKRVGFRNQQMWDAMKPHAK